ncbi:MarR family transcriptional regulator [Bacillaceae bacterium Marseille-Q3522]|nr:MarR family transcriptional regulator [Bacillaceae bacterium Marseille-Q3522]
MEKKDLFYKFVNFTASVHRVKHELTKDTKSDSLTHAQYNILEFLAVNQPVTISQISDCLYMSMPNTSRELRKLADKNLIEKSEDARDRRKQSICLSKAGETMMNVTFKTIETRFLNRIQNASKEDLEKMDLALDILYTKIFY